ncbi:unnamed protein product [Arctia plantaginis]|uniref:Uncharacterized protein n=1 Tax=Arctia plantaginis TaxID=874455 RepID=A0A8S1A6D6_ARCPL|nr:unnamed protein product [Arctia plantaginis]CAB3252727.1 unnamed protein product [Arctia plantaginis]
MFSAGVGSSYERGDLSASSLVLPEVSTCWDPLHEVEARGVEVRCLSRVATAMRSPHTCGLLADGTV